MARRYRLHDGRQRAEQFRELDLRLTALLKEEVERLRAGAGERDLDRGRISKLFEAVGLGDYFGLDWQAPRAEFLATLYRVHDDLWLYAEIYQTYPEGRLDCDDLEWLERPEGWHAED